MKSIKEKARDYGLQYPVIHYDADGNTYDDVDKPSMDFEAGAEYAIAKAAEWLKDFCVEHEIICYADCHEIDNSNELVEIFKKKMEE